MISRITDKWSLLVLYTLEQQEVLRFKELWRQIPDISQKMLTSTLRHLENDGLVSREVFTEVPPRVEYRLSERGKSDAAFGRADFVGVGTFLGHPHRPEKSFKSTQ